MRGERKPGRQTPEVDARRPLRRVARADGAGVEPTSAAQNFTECRDKMMRACKAAEGRKKGHTGEAPKRRSSSRPEPGRARSKSRTRSEAPRHREPERGRAEDDQKITRGKREADGSPTRAAGQRQPEEGSRGERSALPNAKRQPRRTGKHGTRAAPRRQDENDKGRSEKSRPGREAATKVETTSPPAAAGESAGSRTRRDAKANARHGRKERRRGSTAAGRGGVDGIGHAKRSGITAKQRRPRGAGQAQREDRHRRPRRGESARSRGQAAKHDRQAAPARGIPSAGRGRQKRDQRGHAQPSGEAPALPEEPRASEDRAARPWRAPKATQRARRGEPARNERGREYIAAPEGAERSHDGASTETRPDARQQGNAKDENQERQILRPRAAAGPPERARGAARAGDEVDTGARRSDKMATDPGRAETRSRRGGGAGRAGRRALRRRGHGRRKRPRGKREEHGKDRQRWQKRRATRRTRQTAARETRRKRHGRGRPIQAGGRSGSLRAVPSGTKQGRGTGRPTTFLGAKRHASQVPAVIGRDRGSSAYRDPSPWRTVRHATNKREEASPEIVQCWACVATPFRDPEPPNIFSSRASFRLAGTASGQRRRRSAKQVVAVGSTSTGMNLKWIREGRVSGSGKTSILEKVQQHGVSEKAQPRASLPTGPENGPQNRQRSGRQALDLRRREHPGRRRVF